MDGFWWFGHTKPSKQCDLLSFHQDVDDDESGETTNDEDLDMDGPIEAANVVECRRENKGGPRRRRRAACRVM